MRKKLTLKDFKYMEQIELLEFTPENVASGKECYKIYKKFPYYICILEENEKPISWICSLPLKKEVFEKLKKLEIDESDIENDKYGKYLNFTSKDLYLLCGFVFIQKKHRNFYNLKRLLKIFKNHLEDMTKTEYKIKKLIANCSTEYGRRIAKLFKMTPVINTKQNTLIYEMDGEEFIKIML